MQSYLNYMIELLFWALNGNPLIMSLWVFPYVFFWVGISLILIFTILKYVNNKFISNFLIICVVLFSFVSVMIPVPQLHRMSECITSDVYVETPNASDTIVVKECRDRSNYYEDFGEWYIVNTEREP